jgi:16S rRNA (guanine(966)-N(2))-methyltransferase RsmD
VIAGTLRGQRIHTPPTDSVRPTYDRVRESVFGIIEPLLTGAVALDLFAGSGSLGIESLSRGAERVTFVERDPRVLKVTERNVRELGLAGRARVVRADAMRALSGRIPGGPFDVVFVDPPYASGLVPRVLELLAAGGHLNAGAVVVVEHAAGDEFGETAGTLSRTRSKNYGTTEVDFYEDRAGGPQGEERT